MHALFQNCQGAEGQRQTGTAHSTGCAASPKEGPWASQHWSQGGLPSLIIIGFLLRKMLAFGEALRTLGNSPHYFCNLSVSGKLLQNEQLNTVFKSAY